MIYSKGTARGIHRQTGKQVIQLHATSVNEPLSYARNSSYLKQTPYAPKSSALKHTKYRRCLDRLLQYQSLPSTECFVSNSQVPCCFNSSEESAAKAAHPSGALIVAASCGCQIGYCLRDPSRHHEGVLVQASHHHCPEPVPYLAP